MPTPNKKEKKKDFIDRCIPVVIKDGNAKDNKQAVAVCNSIWSEHLKESESISLMDSFKEQCELYQNIKQGIEIPDTSLESIIEISKHIVEKMIESNNITFHPDQMKAESKELLLKCMEEIIDSGPYLSPPYGELVFENQKTAIVKTEKDDRLEKMGLLISGDYAYGFIRCRECEKIDLKEFDKRAKEHRLTESEVDDKNELYYYSIREFIKFDDPRRIESENNNDLGKRFFESTCTPKDWDLSKLDNKELMFMHSDIHNESISYSKISEEKPPNWMIKRHDFIITEMQSRGLKHNSITELDRLSNSINANSIRLRDLNHFLNGETILRVPFLSIMGESCKTGHNEKIDLNLNWPEYDHNFIKLIESKIKELLPDDLKESVKLIPDSEGNETILIPIAELSVRFIKPKNRIMMSCNKGDLNKLRLDEIEKLRGEE
jgi:hypothetical protein